MLCEQAYITCCGDPGEPECAAQQSLPCTKYTEIIIDCSYCCNLDPICRDYPPWYCRCPGQQSCRTYYYSQGDTVLVEKSTCVVTIMCGI